MGVTKPDDGPVSHGICRACAVLHFGPIQPKNFQQVIDSLGLPVVVVNRDGRIRGASRQAAALLGKDAADLAGLLPGEAIECSNAHEPGGCGGTGNCQGCQIRRAINSTRTDGTPKRSITSTHVIVHGARAERMRFVLSTERTLELVVLHLEDIQPDTQFVTAWANAAANPAPR
jgi:PAS domain-containing protein